MLEASRQPALAGRPKPAPKFLADERHSDGAMEGHACLKRELLRCDFQSGFRLFRCPAMDGTPLSLRVIVGARPIVSYILLILSLAHTCLADACDLCKASAKLRDNSAMEAFRLTMSQQAWQMFQLCAGRVKAPIGLTCTKTLAGWSLPDEAAASPACWCNA